MPDTPTTSPPEDVIRSGALVRLSDGARAIVGETDGLVGLCARVGEDGRISDDEAAYLLSELTLLVPAPLASDDPLATRMRVDIDPAGPLASLAEITDATINLANTLSRCKDILDRLPAPIDALTLQASGLAGQIDAMRGTIAAMGPALAEKGEEARPSFIGSGLDNEYVREKVKAATAAAVVKVANLAPLEPACTRRDRAAHATLMGLVASLGLSSPRHTSDQMANRAYELADAMERAAVAPRARRATNDPDSDIAILLAQIDAAREMDGQLSEDPEDIALIEQIRAGRKTHLGEAAR